MPDYSSSVVRQPWEKMGEHISLFDFGAVGDGVTDDSSAINAAISSAVSKGKGLSIFAPGATYAVASPIIFPTACVPILFYGDGNATIFKRTANMPTSQGMIEVQAATDIEFRDFVVEGDVTGAPAGVLYSSITSATDTTLTANTSFWLHPGCKRIKFQNLIIQHTGGYSILIDTITGLIEDVRIIECVFQNNRPHLFGTSGGDLNYGSWTGGIFVNGDGRVLGQNYVLRNFLVKGCTFRRNTGNCLWSHLLGLDELHSNFRFTHNSFLDIGLDGIGMNGVSGFVASESFFRRNGYICTDDTSQSVPKYLSVAYSVGIDTAGVARGGSYCNNTFTSPNGAAIDMDGFCDGQISGNVIQVPDSTVPEYTEDQISITGPGGTGNISYGCQISNTNNDPSAGCNVHITGNKFYNLNGGAIRMYASRFGCADHNYIRHPDAAPIQPIRLGNIGTGANQRSYNNVITNNTIFYNPSSAVCCILEDSSIAAFSSGDTNWVTDNRIIGSAGNAFEFLKDSNTSSITRSIISTQGITSAKSETHIERQLTGNNSLTRIFGVEGATRVLLFDLQHKLFNSVPSVVGGPLLSICNNGTAGTGSITTGARTTLPFDDVIACGRLSADGFLAVNDSTFTYPNDSAADLLPASYGLIRFNHTSGVFQQSISVSGGHRVWTALGASAAAGSNTQIQYNNSGVLGADGNLTWASQLLTITAASSGVAGILCSTGYIQSDAGFYATAATATSYQSIQAPGGGMYANSFRAIKYMQLGNSSGTPSLTAGDAFQAGAMYWDTSGTPGFKFYNGSSWAGFGGGGGVTSIIGGTGVSVSGTTTVTVSIGQDVATTANVTFDSVTTTGVFQSGVTGASIGFQTTNFNFQVNGNGVVSCQQLNVGGSTTIDSSRNVTCATVTVGGTLTINGSRDVTCASVTTVGVMQSSVTGTSIGFQTTNFNFEVNGNGVVSCQQLNVGGSTTINSSRDVTCASVTTVGVVQSSVTSTSIGFQTTNFNFQVNGNGVVSCQQLNVGGSTTIDSSRNVTCATVTVGGTLTINGSRDVTCASVTTTGVVQSQATSTAISFQNTNFNFQVNGNGVVSCQQLNVGGSTTINSSRDVTCTSVTTSGVVQSSATSTAIGFQTTNFNFQVNGNGVMSCQQVNVAGSTTIDGSRNIFCAAVTASIYDVVGGYFGQDATGGLVCGAHTLFFKGGILYSFI